MATPLHAQVGTTWVGGGSPDPTDFYGVNWDIGSLGAGYYGYITTATGNTPVVSTNPGLTLGGVMDGFYGGTGLLTMNSGGVINTTTRHSTWAETSSSVAVNGVTDLAF